MTLIGMDRPDHPTGRPPFRIRNVKSSTVAPEPQKTPTPLGFYLLRAMANAGYDKVNPFARAAGIGQSTMHRYIFGGPGKPDSDTLLQIAVALAKLTPGDEAADVATERIHRELLAEAGYRVGAPISMRDYDPLALELDDLIGERSTLPEMDRDLLRRMVDTLVDPYRRKARRRTG